MKMSTKGRYAVMAMIDIASQPTASPVSLAEIAERQDAADDFMTGHDRVLHVSGGTAALEEIDI